MKQGNVVSFPRNKIVRTNAQDPEVLQKVKEKQTQNYADQVIVNLMETLVMEIDNQGLDRSDEKVIQTFDLAGMIISAAVYRSLGLPHDLHDVIDSYVEELSRMNSESDAEKPE